MLKKITGNDPVRVERKYHDPIGSIFLNALIIITGNQPFTTNDASTGIIRRRLTI